MTFYGRPLHKENVEITVVYIQKNDSKITFKVLF